jgi:hypothetical protein
VVGPASSTDNAIARFDGTTGKLVQNSGVEVDDSGNIKMSYSSGALGRINYQATSGDKVFLLQTITSTNNYGIGVDSSNLVTFGSVSGADTWNVKAIQYSSSGVVTLGPSGGANHIAYGTLSLGPSSSNTGPTPSGLSTFNNSSLSVHWRMFRLSSTTIDHYISGAEYHIINASGGVKLTVGATSWAAISDERQKKNISPLNYGLEKVMQINPIRFDYNSDDSESSKRIGFSAQNLRPIIPEAVAEDVEMDVLSVAPTELIPVLVKAIQELKAELDVAKARIEALENP